MKEPVDHIVRPQLPWRSMTLALTECGYDAFRVKTVTRDEYARRCKDLGTTRAAMITCMTCMQTAKRWEPWEIDPRKAIGREVEWETPYYGSGDKHGTRLKDELLAIAALIDAHPDEFQQLVADIEKRREWLKQKTARPRKEHG